MQQQRRITWTQPPDPETIDALFDLEELEAQDKKAKTEADALRKKLAPVQVEEWRITLRTMSVLDKSRYFAHVRTVEPWLDQMFPAVDGEANPERAGMTITAYRAALVLACIGGMETRRRPVLEADSRNAWEPCALPDGWATVDGYLGSTPPALHDAMAAAAETLNPQVMLRGNAEQAKKFGGVSGS